MVILDKMNKLAELVQLRKTLKLAETIQVHKIHKLDEFNRLVKTVKLAETILVDRRHKFRCFKWTKSNNLLNSFSWLKWSN